MNGLTRIHDPLDAEVPWAAAGPALDDDLRARVADIVGRLGRITLVPGPAIVDHASAMAAVTEAWAALEQGPCGESAADALALVSRLRAVDRELQQLQVARAAEGTRLLTRVISRMEAASVSVPGLVELAPQFICELGFDRGLISRVEDGVWYPELMFIMGDPAWAAVVTEAGKSTPTLLRRGLHETEMLTTREAILVTDAQRDPRLGHRAMVESSLTRSYVGAPILSGGKVIGLLHADRYGQRRDVDELDRRLLHGFAEAFRLVLSRAALAEELQVAHRSLRTVSSSLEEAVGSVHRSSLVRLDRTPAGDPDGLVIRVGTRQTGRPLPDSLTRRELEVLALMAAGRPNAMIAATLVIADGTVKQHVKHILRKLEARTRSEAVARWFQAGS